MSALVDPRDPSGASVGPFVLPAPLGAAPAVPVGLDPDLDFGNNLPGDHPAWTKDMVSLSQRFRMLVAQLRPVVLRVLSFWDHHVRSIVVRGERLAVDASGSYRKEE